MHYDKEDKEIKMMECTECKHTNESDAKYCKNCGKEITITKGTTEFVPRKGRTTGSDPIAGYVLGGIFIIVAILMAAAVLGVFDQIGNFFSGFGAGFGETMGNLGEDFGNFMANWGQNFGASMETFFSGGQFWWDLIQVSMVVVFLLVGVTILIVNYRKNQ
jgi:hypothetical protein